MNKRILAWDISLGCPGVCVMEVGGKKPKIIDVSHIKTDTKQNHAQRAKAVEAWAYLFILKHHKKGFDYIVREDFRGRTSKQSHPVHSAWASIDRALHFAELGLPIPQIAQASVKKHATGNGSAEKWEVEEAVRKITGYKGEFEVDDESDAAGIALAYAMREGIIPKRKEGK